MLQTTASCAWRPHEAVDPPRGLKWIEVHFIMLRRLAQEFPINFNETLIFVEINIVIVQ